MRSPFVALLALAVACDPGAGFRLAGDGGTQASWPVGGDSVRGSVSASAFTISLSVRATLDAPAGVTFALDSSELVIQDITGAPIQLRYFGTDCEDSTRASPLRSRRCVIATANLESTSYRRLDSLTVRYGWAVHQGQRTPLIARFERIR